MRVDFLRELLARPFAFFEEFFDPVLHGGLQGLVAIAIGVGRKWISGNARFSGWRYDWELAAAAIFGIDSMIAAAAIIAVMDFKVWRVAHKVTLLKAARALGFDGQNPARTLHRIESGQAAADADLAADIACFTRGEVTGADLQVARLRYLEKSGLRRRAPGRRARRPRSRASNAIGGAIS